jgi:hypothetical protein
VLYFIGLVVEKAIENYYFGRALTRWRCSSEKMVYDSITSLQGARNFGDLSDG